MMQKNSLRKISSFVSMLILASCISQQTSVISAGGGAPGTPVVARPVVPIPPSGQQIVSKIVPMGTTMTILFAFTLNPDCSVRGLDTIRVDQPPVHGQAKVVQREGYPTFASNNSHFVCNKTKTQGVFIDYTPDAGYTGSDFMVADVITLDGKEARIPYSITVK